MFTIRGIPMNGCNCLLSAYLYELLIDCFPQNLITTFIFLAYLIFKPPKIKNHKLIFLNNQVKHITDFITLQLKLVLEIYPNKNKNENINNEHKKKSQKTYSSLWRLFYTLISQNINNEGWWRVFSFSRSGFFGGVICINKV